MSTAEFWIVLLSVTAPLVLMFLGLLVGVVNDRAGLAIASIAARIFLAYFQVTLAFIAIAVVLAPFYLIGRLFGLVGA